MTFEKTKVKRSMIMSSQEHDDVKMGLAIGKIEGNGNHSLASEAISIFSDPRKGCNISDPARLHKEQKKQKNR